MNLLVLVICFFAFMIMGMPIAFNLIASTFAYAIVAGLDPMILASNMYGGMDSFSFLAVPFFVLTGQFMLQGGLLESLIDLVNAVFGRWKGALAIVTIGVSLLMGSIVGLAVAAAASLGVFLIPMMQKEGYSAPFSAAVMSSASLLGPIMPPSVLMIMYCISAGSTSITGVFLAAVVPAFLIAGAQMLIAHRVASKRNYKSYGKSTMKEKWNALKKALPALMLPIIILGGIFSGIFSITEASAIAALYSGLLAFFVKRSVTLKDVPKLFLDVAATSGLVLLLAAAGTVMAWAIANERVLDMLIGPLSALPPAAFLMMVNVFLLIVGCFMDDYASVAILAPILGPVAWAVGVHPIHFAVIFCVNLVVGLATPPFGITLFVTSPIAGVAIEETVREAIPFIVVTIGVLLLITFVPELVLFLPRAMGYA